MKQINLIPWRAQARVQRKKEFFNSLAFAGVSSLLILLLVHLSLNSTLNEQNSINAIYQQENIKLDQQLAIIDTIKKQQLASVERINIIDKLQANRSQTVDIFNDLVRALPQGVYLLDITSINNTITLSGKAESNTRVSLFMRNLEALPWLQNASLTQIQTDPAATTYTNFFQLDLKLKPLQGLDELAKAAAAAKADKEKQAKNKAAEPAK